MTMKLTPQGNRLLVQLIDEKEMTTASSAKLQLILPETGASYGAPRQGKIVAVGNGEECHRMDFKEGDLVFFSKYAGQEMKAVDTVGLDEEADYLFLNTKDIYGRTPRDVEPDKISAEENAEKPEA